MGDEGIQELACRARYLIDRPVEGRFIGLGRSGEPTQLPNELERGCTDFFIGGRWLEIMQSFDVSTHVLPSLHYSSAPLGPSPRSKLTRSTFLRLNDKAMLRITPKAVNHRGAAPLTVSEGFGPPLC